MSENFKSEPEFMTVQDAAVRLCCSRSQVYALGARGTLRLTKLLNKTVVDAASVRAALATAAPYTPSNRAAAATRARVGRALNL